LVARAKNNSTRYAAATFELDLKQTKTISLRIDTSILRRVDEAVKRFGYPSRSDIIREALEIYIDLLSRLGSREEVRKFLNGHDFPKY